MAKDKLINKLTMTESSPEEELNITGIIDIIGTLK